MPLFTYTDEGTLKWGRGDFCEIYNVPAYLYRNRNCYRHRCQEI